MTHPIASCRHFRADFASLKSGRTTNHRGHWRLALLRSATLCFWATPPLLYRSTHTCRNVTVKRKLSARAPGHSLRMQTRQALLLGLSFNVYRLRHRYLFLRISTEPDKVCVLRVPRAAEFLCKAH